MEDRERINHRVVGGVLISGALALIVGLVMRGRRTDPTPLLPEISHASSAETGGLEAPSSIRETISTSQGDTAPPPVDAGNEISRPEDQNDPSKDLLGGHEEMFKGVFELQATESVNPRHIILSSDQRVALQKLLSRAERDVRTAIVNTSDAAKQQGQHLIDQGLGWDVPRGQQARQRGKSDDFLYAAGGRAISFNSREDPAVAPFWKKRDDTVADYSRQIREFFSMLP